MRAATFLNIDDAILQFQCRYKIIERRRFLQRVAEDLGDPPVVEPDVGWLKVGRAPCRD